MVAEAKDRSDWIKNWEEKLTAGAPGLQLAWRPLLNKAASYPINRMETILKQRPEPTTFNALLTLLERDPHCSRALVTFFNNVDDSNEDLNDWLCAVKVLHDRTNGSRIKPNLTGATGYLHCASFAVGTGSNYETFEETVLTMLDLYGYEGREETRAV